MNLSKGAIRATIAISGIALFTASLSACSTGAADGPVEITVLMANDESSVSTANALIDAFEAENPDITVTLNTQPLGAEGDNLVRTKLATGEMEDVFYYNSGSLLQPLNPDETLVDLSDEEWVADTSDDWKSVVSTDEGLYGAPFGTAFAGGIIFNKAIFADLGLEVPTDWATFLEVSQTIKDNGIVPIVQTYSEPWTSQLFVLGDFANVSAQDPGWADDYTANEAKYVDEPAFAGFRHLQEAYDAGLFNEDFASAGSTDGIVAVGSGSAAMYPMLTAVVVPTLAAIAPEQLADVGVFAIPADDADNTRLTVWQPNALYIPRTTEGAELEAAKKFIAFANSPAGCDAQNAFSPAAGPFVISTCSVPEDAAPLVADVQSYLDSDTAGVALEFLSPVKGPNLENITVEVGSGIRSAEDGAAAYDADVAKQAQQLGLEGW
jgi:raffinose/stachyose/melibiose transport system substrate-binding protein